MSNSFRLYTGTSRLYICAAVLPLKTTGKRWGRHEVSMKPEKLKVDQNFNFKYTYYTLFTLCISLIALQLFLAASTAILTSW
jgi:hypothetical protein